MSHPELNQLTRAEELFDDGELEKALEILNDQSQFEGLNPQQKNHYQFLKGLILIYQNKSEKVSKLGEQILKEGQKLKKHLQSIDGYFFIIFGPCLVNKFKEVFKFIEKAEASLKLISNTSKKILIRSEARIRVLKAYANVFGGNIEIAEKCVDWILGSQKELGNTFEIVWANLLMAQIMMSVKSRFDLAMEYTNKAMSLAKNIKFNHYWIAICHIFFGVIYYSIGEFNTSLKHHIKSLAIFKEINNNLYTAAVLNNIGNIYINTGDYDLALEYYEESLSYYETQSIELLVPLGNLVELALEKGDIELAQKYFQRVEDRYNQTEDADFILNYQFIKALMLKNSSRIRDKAEVEKLLKQVIKTETFRFDVIIYAHIHLCDLLLAEYRLTNNSEILDELNHYIAKLLTIAEKSHSYLFFCEAFLLQAKLALINFNMKAARRFLTQAQKIAESYGIKRLAIKISHEHDELLRQIKLWENLKESESSLSERCKLAGLDNHMENMVKKRMLEVPEVLEEDPVSIFIITEGGTPLFSHSFIDQKTFESHLFSGFLTTIDYFIREMFSEGLDRAIFGEYTLLLKSIPPFFISYIYKGDSYHAFQKLNYFIDNIQKQDEIWRKLIKSFQVNQSIKLRDIPLLNSLIIETFITKSIASSEF
ncbi:MAG: tetratricopeptide repeat protein [Candidatus Hodarchaeota archaeon]